MDSDLAESLSALQEIFSKRGLRPEFAKADDRLVQSLKEQLRLPRRFRDFLLEADPVNVETSSPSERVRLLPSGELVQEQIGFSLGEDGSPNESPAGGWRPSWVIIGVSGLLGDPYFLDTSKPDAEGDCPVYTAMSGTDSWQPRLCASSFALFVRILAVSMEVAQGFSDGDDFDMDDEHVFREALAPKIREYDPAALKAGHWT